MANETDSKVPPPDTPEYFNRFSRYYDEEVQADGWPEKAQALVRSVLKVKPAHSIESALDLGAGTGVSTEAIKKLAAPERLVAVDASPGMLDHLRHKDPDYEVEVVIDDIDEYLARATERFDLIVALGVLDLLASAPRTISNAQDLLRPGGVLAFTYPPRKDGEPREILTDDSGSLIASTLMEYRWYPDEVEAAVASSGLAVVGRVDGIRVQEYDPETNTDERVWNFIVASQQ